MRPRIHRLPWELCPEDRKNVNVFASPKVQFGKKLGQGHNALMKRMLEFR